MQSEMFEIGTEVKLSETYKEYWVTLAKKGQKATVVGYDTKRIDGGDAKDIVLIKLANGNETHVQPQYLEVYTKKITERLEDYTDEKLLDHFELISVKETHKKVGSKVQQKLTDELLRCKAEILKRMATKSN